MPGVDAAVPHPPGSAAEPDERQTLVISTLVALPAGWPGASVCMELRESSGSGGL